MKFVTALIIFTSLLVISACDNKPQQSKIKNPLADQVEALDKAKDVERQLLEASEKQRKAIDNMSK
jgi:hypothetical protein